MTRRWVHGFEGGMIGLILLAVAMEAAPQVSRARAENRVALLAERLQQVRSSIAVYQAEHDGALPGLSAEGHLSGEAFAAALTGQADGGRTACLDRIPANPFIDGQAAREVTVVCRPDARPTGREGTGWWFNAATGHFAACDSRYHAAY